MRGLARRAGRAALLLAIGGGVTFCRTLPSSGGAKEPALEFSILGQAEEAEGRAPTLARVGSGTIEVTGAVATPTPCYTIGAELAAGERTLTLTLVASARDAACVQVLAAFEYSATVSGLEPGTYAMVVVQTYPGTGWPRREHRLQLSVP